MLIADSQVHIWTEERPDRPWRSGRRNQAHRDAPFTRDDLVAEMDRAGVDRAVLVPPSMEGDRNDVVLEAAQADPARFRVMGRIPLENPDVDLVSDLASQPGMAGLRVTFFSAGELIAHPDELNWLWSAAEKRDLPLMVSQSPNTFDDISRIAREFPALRIAIDHLGVVRGKLDDAAFAGVPRLVELARFPNLSVKLTALQMHTSEEYPYPGIHKYLRLVHQAFGPRRLFWGTDLTRLPCSYQQAITLFTEELPWLSATDKELIMGRSLCRWLDWDPIEGAGLS